MTQSKVPDIQSHTALRGIAALLVVAFHYRRPLIGFVDVERHTLFLAKSHVWVDLFFILSGFILRHVYGTRFSAGMFLRHRFARVYPLHAATLMFMLVWMAGLPLVFHRTPESVNWYTFGLNVLLVHAWGFVRTFDWNFPSWSISAEFAAYLLFIPFCVCLRRLPRVTRGAVLLMLLSWVVYAATTDVRVDWSRIAVLRALPMFFLGSVLYDFRPTALRMRTGTTSVLQALAVAAIIPVMHYGLNDSWLIVPFAVLVFATQADRGLLAVLARRPVRHLGEISYSIYLLHMPVIFVLTFAWPKLITQPLHLSDAASAWSLVCSALAATLLMGHASLRYFEMPLRRLIVRGRAAPAPLAVTASS